MPTVRTQERLPDLSALDIEISPGLELIALGEFL